MKLEVFTSNDKHLTFFVTNEIARAIFCCLHNKEKFIVFVDEAGAHHCINTKYIVNVLCEE